MNQKPNKAIVALIIIVLLAAAGAGIYALTRSSENDTTNQQTSVNDSDSMTPPATSDAYTDGEYEATGSYRSPGGNESIDVVLTLSGGTVTEAEVTANATNSTSRGYQNDFIGSFESEVVGKSINDIDLDAVGGSSLTPIGFNDALDQIRQDAAV